MIRFLLKNGRSQLFSEEEHGEFFKEIADRFHRMHQHRIITREHLTKQIMQLTAMSTQSATIVTADGRTVVITEGLPVVITPQDIQPAPEVVASVEAAPVDEAPIEVAPEVPVVAPAAPEASDATEIPTAPASAS